nr:MAG TPA: hypothetical protein [Caudoviricetes sp.]
MKSFRGKPEKAESRPLRGAAFLRPDVQKTTYTACYAEIMEPRKKMKKVRDQRDKSGFPRRTKTVKKSPKKELKP